MADNEEPPPDTYDPTWLNPGGSLFNQIRLENHMDIEHGDSENPNNGTVPFDIQDIQPGQEEFLQGEDQFQIIDVDHMRDYFNSLLRWIAYDNIPPDLKTLRESINLLRLNCQYSHANICLLRSLNGFDMLIGALTRHFDATGLRNGSGHMSRIGEMGETLNLCQEIVKLLEILGFRTGTPSFSETLCSIMRIVYFESQDMKDLARVVRLTHAMLYDVMLPSFDNYYDIIYHHLQNPLALSRELSLCADVTNRLMLAGIDNPPWTVYPLCQALGTLVSRICNDGENNRVNEEYRYQCAALENVMKVLCRLCVKFGSNTVFYMSRDECGVLVQIRKILKHALLHPRAGAQSFKGKHLLYALLMAKHIYDSPGGNNMAGPEDVKVVLDFAMSDLVTRYLFDGNTRLKDLADVIVSTVLNSRFAQFVLDNWASF